LYNLYNRVYSAVGSVIP